MMSITNAPVDPCPLRIVRSRATAVKCDGGLRRLDRLIWERDDVLLAHARDFVARAATLSRLIVRAERGGHSYSDG